ncbi:MAG: hypothetical protein U0869_10930 [Chloroflexota bacterium]
MSAVRDDAILTETLERVRRAELATVLYPPGTPEHTRAVERLDRVTRQMQRLEQAGLGDGGTGSPDPGARGGMRPGA